jgi:hypothetical protein
MSDERGSTDGYRAGRGRRNVLKALGAGGIATLAGCLGGGNGNGNGGGNGNGNGENGGDTPESTSTGTPGESLTTVNINFPAAGPWTVAMKQMESEGVLQQNLNDAGYEPDFQYTWEGSTLYAGGKMDIVHFSPLEAAVLGVERDIETTVVGRIATLYEGFFTRPDSPYDPAVAGGAQAAIDKLAEDNATMVVGSWAGGDIPGAQVAFDQFGVTFTQDESPFEVVTASYPAIPKLVSEGEADIGLTSPADSGRWAMNGKITPIIQFPPYFNENMGFMPPLVDVATGTAFLDENPEAVSALVETWDEAMDWFFDIGPDVIETTEDAKAIGRDTVEGGKYAVRWLTQSEGPRYAFEEPKLYQNPYATDDWSQGQQDFLSTVNENGIIPDGWDDQLSFQNLE